MDQLMPPISTSTPIKDPTPTSSSRPNHAKTSSKKSSKKTEVPPLDHKKNE